MIRIEIIANQSLETELTASLEQAEMGRYHLAGKEHHHHFLCRGQRTGKSGKSSGLHKEKIPD